MISKLQTIVNNCEERRIILPGPLIEDINRNCKWLEAERNLRHFLTYFKEGEITEML